MTAAAPLVSVITPAYNGAKYLSECIESVLAQTYQNWEYTIVNNCSTDDTLQIAHRYAAQDPRIRVVTNTRFVGVAENYNNGFRLVSPESSYCKAIASDDWLLPDCLSKMVAFGLAHPNVGIIGAYQQSGDSVRWQDLPVDVTELSGREACRLALLKRIRIFGAPSGFLYRSDIVRGPKPFFPNSQPHADTSACYEVLDRCDFGMVHEILAAERVHPGQISTKIDKFLGGGVAYLEVFLVYGPKYLEPEEFSARKAEVLDYYYSQLGRAALKFYGKEFWAFHSKRLRDLQMTISWPRVFVAMLKNIFEEASHPIAATRKLSASVQGSSLHAGAKGLPTTSGKGASK